MRETCASAFHRGRLVAAVLGMWLDAAGRIGVRSTSGGITVLEEDRRFHNRTVVTIGDTSHLPPAGGSRCDTQITGRWGRPIHRRWSLLRDHEGMGVGPEARASAALARSWRAAVAHVAASTCGPALDRSLPVTLHFHPDRLVGDRLLLEHLAVDRVYRSQFETGTSNGGLTAHPGGDRWRWESRLFGGAYDSAPAAQRPKYGSLNHRRRPAGGSVRFGSAHFRLAASVLERTTFCYPDSAANSTAVGVAAQMPLIALAEQDERSGRFDALDDYIEAHVHGPLQLGRDVEALVLDPCYRNTLVEAAAAALPFATEWHHGFRLHVDELHKHADYRGQHVIDVAEQVVDHHHDNGSGWLDARVLGLAARSGRWDSQDLKRVWHCIARFGRPTP